MRFPTGNERRAGTVIPVSALRSERSIGVGEFADLIDFADFCEKASLRVIQILPVNDTGGSSSPYGALSAFALHPLYLRIGDLPEAAPFAPDIAAIRKRFEDAGRFDYRGVLDAKMDLLKRIFAAHAGRYETEAAGGAGLGVWIRENPWVIEYAVFRRLKDAAKGAHWKEWSVFRTPKAEDIAKLWNDAKHRKDHLFWAWLQRALDDQFATAARVLYERGIALEGDIPILMNEDSADVWAHPEFFRSGQSAGAPPDMYSPQGQNWGFPIYDWDAQEKDGFSWWKRRLKVADRYYSAYRIDHVLGFFRIWAANARDRSSALARFVPSVAIERKELEALGFGADRIRWLSRSHVRGDCIRRAAAAAADPGAETERIIAACFERIGNEDLFLFKKSIAGEMDLENLSLAPECVGALQEEWRNRCFVEFEAGRFERAWYYRNSQAYASLSENEKRGIEELLEKKRVASEAVWEEKGRGLLKALCGASPMLPCAEDLGVVPNCVPKVLGELGILGLRVLRWTREWEKPGEPYVAPADYPVLSVCTPAVHDSSTVREWWEREADRDILRRLLGETELKDRYSPNVAKTILSATSAAASRICVFQIQDLLHLTEGYYAQDAAAERVNVPGTVNDFNWTYRIPKTVKELTADVDLAAAIIEVNATRRATPTGGTPAGRRR